MIYKNKFEAIETINKFAIGERAKKKAVALILEWESEDILEIQSEISVVYTGQVNEYLCVQKMSSAYVFNN